MKLKAIIICFLALLGSSAIAQDKIFQSNGNVIEAKIKMVKDNSIIYWHWNDRNGSLYAIAVQEVDKVRYENGTEEVFEGSMNTSVPSARHSRPQYGGSMGSWGNKMIAFSPVFFTENGIGAAVSYERMLDRNGIVSFSLPIAATMNPNSSTESDNNKHEDIMVYVAPGIKFYPTGSRGLLKYAVGPSLVLGVGEKTTGGPYSSWQGYNQYSYFEPYRTRTKAMMGVIVNNSLNISPSAHVFMGFDFGFGFTYINNVGGSNFGVSGVVQGGFKIGYRN